MVLPRKQQKTTTYSHNSQSRATQGTTWHLERRPRPFLHRDRHNISCLTDSFDLLYDQIRSDLTTSRTSIMVDRTMVTFQEEDDEPRVPEELQKVFIASNRGETVDVPPRDGLAFKDLGRKSRPILKTRIPRELQAVFLASWRGEDVTAPPKDGLGFKEFQRKLFSVDKEDGSSQDMRSRSKRNSLRSLLFGKDSTFEFDIELPPMVMLSDDSDSFHATRCHLLSSDPSSHVWLPPSTVRERQDRWGATIGEEMMSVKIATPVSPPRRRSSKTGDRKERANSAAAHLSKPKRRPSQEMSPRRLPEAPVVDAVDTASRWDTTTSIKSSNNLPPSRPRRRSNSSQGQQLAPLEESRPRAPRRSTSFEHQRQ